MGAITDYITLSEKSLYLPDAKPRTKAYATIEALENPEIDFIPQMKLHSRTTDYLPHLLTLVSLSCLAGAIWIAALTPKPIGYELTLYENYPIIFWVLTIAASLSSTILLLTLSRNQNESRWWIIGLLGIIVINTFLLSLPLFLGYALNNRADALNHVGYVRDIQKTGTLSPLEFYPGMHFLQFALETIGGATASQALIIVNIVFTLLWTIGPVMLVYRLTGDIRAAYLAAAFTAPLWLLYYHVYILPSVLSTYLIPILLALHLCRKDPSIANRSAVVISEIIIALLLVYLHPATTLYSIALLVIFEISSNIYRLIKRRILHNENKIDFLPFIGMATILTVTFFTWYFSFSIFTDNFSKTISWLLGEQDRSSALGEALGLLQIAQLPITEFIKIILNAFITPIMIVALTGLLAVLFSIYHIRIRQFMPYQHFAYLVAFIAICYIMVLTFAINTSERHPIRLLRILVVLGISLSAWWMWEAILSYKSFPHWPSWLHTHRKYIQLILVIFLGIVIGLSQLNLYENPRNGLPNQRVTFSEMSGMEWLTHNRYPSATTASILPDYVTRFDAYFFGFEGMRYSRPNWWEKEIWIPSGFYKDNWKCISEIAPDETAYLVLSDNGRIASLRFPEAVRGRAHIYTSEDWQKLAADQSVSKIYDNGAFEVWITNKDAIVCKYGVDFKPYHH